MKLVLPLLILSTLSLFVSTNGFISSVRSSQAKQGLFIPESSVDATVLDSQGRARALNQHELQSYGKNSDGQSAVIHMMKQQTTVIGTSLVVAMLAVAARQLPNKTLIHNLKTGTVIFMVGDWAAQLLTHWKLKLPWNTFQLDSQRFILSTILGCIWGGYVNPTIYATVEYLVPGKSVKLVLMKMAMTCSILSTWGNYTTMMFRRFFKQVWQGIVSSGGDMTIQSLVKKSFRDSIQSCNHDFLQVLKDDLKIWPLYDITCYSIIPPTLRPLTNALMASGWAMYMSIASAKQPSDSE